MRKTNTLLIALLFIGVFMFMGCKTSHTDKSKETTVLAGRWEGKAYQYDIAESWDIVLQCSKDRNEYKINYPSLECGGTWILQQYDAKRFFFVEKITYGTGCTNSGWVVIEMKNNNNADFYYYWPTNDVLSAKGQIHRVK